MNQSIPVTTPTAQRQEAFWSWIDQQVRQMIAATLETLLQVQQQTRLAANWNQRTSTRQGYRNGTYSRRLVTPYGPLAIAVPRCRQGGVDCSAIFQPYQRRIGDVDRILRHAYLLGTSARATAELAEQVFGGSLSHQTVSQLLRWLDAQIRHWRAQPLENHYKVVYIDGMHVDVRGGDRTVMLVCGQQQPDQTPDVLGFCVSTGEQCRDLIQDLRQRGLQTVDLFVSDGSGAIRSALEEVYPEVPWQSCAFHRLKDLRETIGPADCRDAMVAQAGCVFRAPSKAAAVEAAVAWAQRWRQTDRAAVGRFLDGLTDSLMFYTLSQAWWKRARTNNPIERLIETLRMRLDPMGCFYDTPAIERAVFGQLLRWHKIKLTHNS